MDWARCGGRPPEELCTTAGEAEAGADIAAVKVVTDNWRWCCCVEPGDQRCGEEDGSGARRWQRSGAGASGGLDCSW